MLNGLEPIYFHRSLLAIIAPPPYSQSSGIQMLSLVCVGTIIKQCATTPVNKGYYGLFTTTKMNL